MKRFSIALLMIIILLIAADIALVRAVWGGPGPSPAYLAIVLPMANLLLLASPKLGRGQAARRFWVGFEVVGWSVILLSAYFDQYQKQTFFAPLVAIQRYFDYPPNSAPEIALGLTCCVILYTPPQLLLAWLGGWFATLSAKYRLAIERR